MRDLHSRSIQSLDTRGQVLVQVGSGCLACGYGRSRYAAVAMPPAVHTATTARRLLRRASSRSVLPTYRIPDMPYGCPSATAPPLTFVISQGVSSCAWL